MSLLTLGIDPSLSSTGLVFLLDGKPMSHRRLKTNPKEEKEQRIWRICYSISSGLYKYQPDFIIMEDYSFASHRSNAATSLHELGGAIKQVLFQSKIPWHTAAPTSLKAFIAHGRASKDEVIAAVQKEWPKCPKQNDIADAYVAAKYAYEKYEELVTPVLNIV